MHIFKSPKTAFREEKKRIIDNIYRIHIYARCSPKHLKEKVWGELPKMPRAVFLTDDLASVAGKLTGAPSGVGLSQGRPGRPDSCISHFFVPLYRVYCTNDSDSNSTRSW